MLIRVMQQSRQWRAAKEGETPAFWASSPALALWWWERANGPIPAGTVVQVGIPAAVTADWPRGDALAETPPPAPTPAHETPGLPPCPPLSCNRGVQYPNAMLICKRPAGHEGPCAATVRAISATEGLAAALRLRSEQDAADVAEEAPLRRPGVPEGCSPAEADWWAKYGDMDHPPWHLLEAIQQAEAESPTEVPINGYQ